MEIDVDPQLRGVPSEGHTFDENTNIVGVDVPIVSDSQLTIKTITT
jgi:hypothetical protein